jgi:hypothetical protein
MLKKRLHSYEHIKMKIAELEMAHFSLAYGLKFSEWY